MINVLVIFLTWTILFILGLGGFVVGVNAGVKDEDDDTTLTSEETEKLENTLYSVAVSCKTELRVMY